MCKVESCVWVECNLIDKITPAAPQQSHNYIFIIEACTFYQLIAIQPLIGFLLMLTCKSGLFFWTWLPADRRIKLTWAPIAKCLYGNTLGNTFCSWCIIPQVKMTDHGYLWIVSSLSCNFSSNPLVELWMSINIESKHGETGLSLMYLDLASQGV